MCVHPYLLEAAMRAGWRSWRRLGARACPTNSCWTAGFAKARLSWSQFVRRARRECRLLEPAHTAQCPQESSNRGAAANKHSQLLASTCWFTSKGTHWHVQSACCWLCLVFAIEESTVASTQALLGSWLMPGLLQG